MNKPDIKINIGDHTRELKRIHRLLLPQELKEKTEKKLSEYEAAKRWKLREDAISIMKTMEEFGFDADGLIELMQANQYKQQRRSSQGSMFPGSQYPT